MLKFLKSIIFNKYIWLLLVPLIGGWLILAKRLEIRTFKATGEQLESVKQIWGGNLAQPMPSIRYKRFGSDVASLSRGEIHASTINVTLQVDYRKKGLVYYTGYHAEFEGKYTISNPASEKIYLSFIFPYPTRKGEGALQNVKLLVNGQEDVEDTEYQPELALWTGVLESTKTLEIIVHYQGRGLNQFEYGFEPGHQINNFAMNLQVQGTATSPAAEKTLLYQIFPWQHALNLDYAESTMPPTEPVKETPQGKILTWKLDRALSQFNIGVILPDKLNIEKQLAIMTYRAPFFFLLFLASLSAILLLSQQRPEFTQVGVISVTYFLFYPLFAYLATYLEITWSFLLAFSIIGLLIFNYVRTLHGRKVALAVFTAYLFYLGITSLAALLPTYTGLILTIEGVILMGIIMQILSQHRDFNLDKLFNWKTAGGGHV